MSSFNIGDALFQLSGLIILVLFIALIVWLFRSFSKRNYRLDSIEKKIDDINNQIKRDSD